MYALTRTRTQMVRRRQAPVWPEQELSAPKLLDRVLLLLNLMPIAISAAARGCLWLLEINMAGFPFCSHARHVNWADHLRGAPESKSDELTDEERLERVKSALVERRASQFPHAGARAFTYHIAGVANMLGAWEQPFDICLVSFPRTYICTCVNNICAQIHV